MCDFAPALCLVGLVPDVAVNIGVLKLRHTVTAVDLHCEIICYFQFQFKTVYFAH